MHHLHCRFHNKLNITPDTIPADKQAYMGVFSIESKVSREGKQQGVEQQKAKLTGKYGYLQHFNSDIKIR